MLRLLLLAFSLFGLMQSVQGQTAPKIVPPTTTTALLKAPNSVLLDVRTPAEFATGHLAGAQNLDFRAPAFRDEVGKLDKTKTYVLYCASGNRSNQTLLLMEEVGFKNVVNAGGFKELKAAGLKTE